MKKKYIYYTISLVIIIGAMLYILWYQDKCACNTEESTPAGQNNQEENIVENFVNEKSDLIQLTFPEPGSYVSSPLTITGRARGSWYFEASFPVVLVDWDGLIIAQGIAQAQGDWMTEDFVPFSSTLTFEKPAYKNNGAIILQKDNPSGLPEYDDALEVPIFYR